MEWGTQEGGMDPVGRKSGGVGAECGSSYKKASSRPAPSRDRAATDQSIFL